jgi:hypothetical protein
VIARPHTRRPRHPHSHESGYVYLMALFMVLIVIVGSTVILEDAATQGRRARESEMMWRGKQYVRAIKLYYRKTGHYPQDLDTLQKGVGNIHFLRAAYPDPMNKDQDGKWRFIYTNATGAIIGSVRYATMQQMAILDLNGGIIPGVQGDQNGQDSNVTPVPQPDQGNCPNVTPVNADASSANPGGFTPGNPNASAPQAVSGMPGSNSPNPNPAQPGDANANQASGGAQPGCPPNQNQQVGMQNQPGAMQSKRIRRRPIQRRAGFRVRTHAAIATGARADETDGSRRLARHRRFSRRRGQHRRREIAESL